MGFKNIFSKPKAVNVENIKSDFVSLSSHQLRTPLSAIKWYIELLLNQKSGKLSDKQHEYLKQIYRSNERAINLVNDLLDVSRLQQGQIHLEFRPTKIEGVVSEVIDNLNDLIKNGKISLNFEIIRGPLPQVNTDREKLKRILVNIISNAVRYTPPDGRVRIAVEKESEKIKITVSDSGVGIPQSDQSKIFDKFFRSSNAMKLAPDGTGLGLFISKSLLEAMGGQIRFRSAEGKGTIFNLILPITQ